MNLTDQLNSKKGERVPDARFIENTDVDWSLVHFFIFLVVGAAIGVLTSLALSHFNLDPTGAGLLRVSIWAMLLMLVMLLQSFLIKSFQLNLYLVLIETIGLLAFFFSNITNWIAIAGLLFVAAALNGFHKGREDLTDHLRIKFGRFSRIVLGALITGAALFTALFYTGAYQESGGMSFPAFRFMTSGSTPAIRIFVPTFSPAMSVSDFFTDLARSQFKNNAKLALLSEAEKEQVFEGIGFELRNQLVEITRTTTVPGESTVAYFYRVTNHYLEVLSKGPFAALVFLIIALLIFSLIKTVMFILKWPLSWIGSGVYKLLRITGVIYITTEPRSKEIIMVGKRHFNK